MNTNGNNENELLTLPYIKLPIGECSINGSIENFTISIYTEHNQFDFNVKYGDIVSYKTSNMLKEKNYGGE